MSGLRVAVGLALLGHAAWCAAADDGAGAPAGDWRFDGQFTAVTQKHPDFRAPYSGPNSLLPSESAKTTTDLTAFIGRKLGAQTELWLNPEIDQGFGLSNTLGVAGFPSGEAYKVGAHDPYLRLPRVFVRHTASLGGESAPVEAGTNQFAMIPSADNLVLTVGRFSVVDVFDTNTFAHDPRADFLNWSVIDSGAFDYAADSWGYTVGASAEWTHGAWTWRGGVFQMSNEPNSKVTGIHFDQKMWVGEVEHRHQWAGRAGKLKLLAFQNRARMGSYRDAVDLAQATSATPDIALVRRFQTRPGWAIQGEQQLSDDLGAFARISANDGRKEAYEFTEINQSVAAGLRLLGTHWGRPQDALGFAVVVNGLSRDARDYFTAGGMGILIGDGALNYGSERIVETYYSASVARHLAVAFDFQRIVNPAYNRDRGPVSVFGARLHAEF